jgi:hypothetical protein
MKSFRTFISEEVLPTAQVADGGMDIEKPAVRAAINAALTSVASQPAVTPYVVYNRISKLLSQYHIIMPKKFLEGDKGVEVFEVRQFGLKMGMTDSGEFVKEVPTTHYLFLQYGLITPMGITYAKPVVGGMYKVTAKLVDKMELDRLLDMAEITMSEEAECRQMSAKAMAPKEPMHDITSDEKKKGNKAAVADSEKGLDEAKSYYASTRPKLMNVSRMPTATKSDKPQKADSPAMQAAFDKIAAAFPPGSIKVGGRKKVEEGRVLRSIHDKDEHKPTPAYAKKMEQEKKDDDDKKRNASIKKDLKKFDKKGLFSQIKEGRMPSSVIKHKQKLAGMTDAEKKAKFAGKSEAELKAMAHRHGYGKDSNEYSKHGSFEKKQIDELKKSTTASYKKKASDDLSSAKTYHNWNIAQDYENPKTREKSVAWSRNQVAKREKGIKMADKRLEEKAPPGAKYEIERMRQRASLATYGKDYPADIKPVRSEETINEKLTKKMKVSDVISDFVHSDDPKFKGKSKKERQKMALGAYYGQRNLKKALQILNVHQEVVYSNKVLILS